MGVTMAMVVVVQPAAASAAASAVRGGYESELPGKKG